MDVAPLTIVPFVALLLAIALLPLLAPRFWHSNLNRALVALLLAGPVVGYLYAIDRHAGQPGLAALGHALVEYGEFILLLGSLYVIAGGIVIEGRFRPTPPTNVLFLAGGAVLANLIGTTGASLILARPLLRINRPRPRHTHVPIFFLFIVSNVGGLLTPLGDPPLFLGFLRGIPFSFTLTLWPHWLIVNGIVLALFFLWDHTCAPRADAGAGRCSRPPNHGSRSGECPAVAGCCRSGVAALRGGRRLAPSPARSLAPDHP